ncbi:MAG: hypothetical protein EBS24_07920 [Chitinophagia bacterium]|jgi:hypothetical protein|nr:hypothetical protein [Chitinophagia bacterium]
MRKTNYYSQVVQILHSLHNSYPEYNMGRHLSTALDGYGDLWGVTDKELLFALEKYKAQLDMDVPHTDEKEIDQIIRDGMNLDDILKEEDGEDF